MDAQIEKIEEEMAALKVRIGELDRERRTHSRGLRRAAIVLGFCCIISGGLYGGYVFSDPGVPTKCIEGSDLYCFDQKTPAKASEVNHNFQQLRTDIEGIESSLQALSDAASTDTIVRGARRTYSSVSGTSAQDAWYSLFAITDYGAPVLCNIRCYGHTSASFVVSRGFNSNPLITVLQANTANANPGYKTIKGIRMTDSGTVQIKLSGGSSVNIAAQVIGNGGTNPTLEDTLIRETGSPVIGDTVDSLPHGSMRIPGNLYTRGSVNP